MKMKRTVLLSLFALALFAGAASAASWRQKKDYKNDMGSELSVEMTYYAAVEVERDVAEKTDANLWTADEADNYRYSLLQQLKMDEYIPIHVKFVNNGPALRMAPFDAQLKLFVGKAQLRPVDYDKRFNFKITGPFEGFVYFPRFDEKGKPYITPKVKTLKLILNGGISPVTISRNIEFIWDIKDDNPEKLLEGRAGAKIEVDRLLKRLANLTERGKKLQAEMDEVTEEIRTVNARVMELQNRQ